MTEANSKHDESPLPSPPTELEATLAAGTHTHSRQHDGRAKRAVHRIWHHLHYRFPWLVPTPHNPDLAHHRQQDVEDNVASRVPEMERLRQVALWGVEIFGPAEADRLNSAMKSLGWNDDHLFSLNANPGSWIGEQRTYGSEGSLNLGVIQRPGKNRFLLHGRQAPLPDAVDYAFGWVYQLSPSVTAVSLCFVLRDDASNRYQTEINVDRKTVHEAFERGYRLHNVADAKRRAIDQERTRARALVTKWFATYLPGFFSTTSDGNRLPTTELLTTNSQSLFVTNRVSITPDWVQLTTPLGHREVWTLKSFGGLKLCWPEFDGDLRYHSVANLRTDLLTAQHLKYRGDPSDEVFASFADDHVRGVLVNFAAIAALREIIRRLRLTPSTLSADTTSRQGTVKCLEQIRLFFDKSIGIPAFTSELSAKSEQVHSYRRNCAEFQSNPWRVDEQPILISDELRARTHFLASRAQSLERESREQLEQLSTILSTRENIRTQARMELVTVAAAIVSIASLVVAVMSVDQFSSYITQLVERLIKPN